MCPEDLGGGLGASPTPGGLSRVNRQLDQFLSQFSLDHRPTPPGESHSMQLGSPRTFLQGCWPGGAQASLMTLMPQATSHSLGEEVG